MTRDMCLHSIKLLPGGPGRRVKGFNLGLMNTRWTTYPSRRTHAAHKLLKTESMVVAVVAEDKH